MPSNFWFAYATSADLILSRVSLVTESPSSSWIAGTKVSSVWSLLRCSQVAFRFLQSFECARVRIVLIENLDQLIEQLGVIFNDVVHSLTQVRKYVRLPILRPRPHRIRLGIVRKAFRSRIECQPATEPVTDVGQVNQRRRVHAFLYLSVQILPAPALDRIQKVLHVWTGIARLSLSRWAGLSFWTEEALVAEVIQGQIALLPKKDVADEIRAARLDSRFPAGRKPTNLE